LTLSPSRSIYVVEGGRLVALWTVNEGLVDETGRRGSSVSMYVRGGGFRDPLTEIDW